jgi:ribosomal-protein-alanine N-acetyltransferase
VIGGTTFALNPPKQRSMMNGEMSIDASVVLDGTRVQLRAPCGDDAERLVTFQRDNRHRFARLDGERPEEFYTAAWWMRRIAALEEGERAGRLLYFVVIAKSAPSRVAGVVSFTNIAYAPFFSCEIGFAVDEAHEGTGVMREALQLAIDDLFKRRGMHRVSAEYAATNVRSQGLLARLGFRQEGVLRSYMRVDGRWEDFTIAALINNQWREPR